MKRIRVYEYGGPEELQIEDAPDTRPSSGEVLIRVGAIGVHPHDTYARSGNYGMRDPALPYTPGSDAAGVVEAVGSGVAGIVPGTRVYTSGTLSGAYAEFALCNPEQVQALPDAVGFVEGAAVFVPYATAYHAPCSTLGMRNLGTPFSCTVRAAELESRLCSLPVPPGSQ